MVSDTCKPNVVIRYRYGHPEMPGNLIRETYPRLHESDDMYYVERESVSEASTCILIPKQKSSDYQGWMYPEKEQAVRKLDTLLVVSEFETLFSSVNGFCLHSSIVKVDGKAILFSAPSGTGKSTQAELWKTYRNADILNGDRAMIRKAGNEWTAFGSPFAGSSGIYRNEGAPISIVVILGQGLENSIQKLSPAQAFRSVYSETIAPQWNKEATQQIVDGLADLIQTVPIVRMQCLPDHTAVEFLDDYIKRH